VVGEGVAQHGRRVTFALSTIGLLVDARALTSTDGLGKQVDLLAQSWGCTALPQGWDGVVAVTSADLTGASLDQAT